MDQAKRINIDRVGICASAICAVHCVVTGLALGVLSVLGLGFIHSPALDAVFLGLAVLIGIVAVRHGARVHRSFLPATVFVFGLGLVGAGHFVFGHDSAVPNAASVTLSVLGGLSLIAFHALNLKMRRERRCCHEAHCSHGEEGSSRA